MRVLEGGRSDWASSNEVVITQFYDIYSEGCTASSMVDHPARKGGDGD